MEAPFIIFGGAAAALSYTYGAYPLVLLMMRQNRLRPQSAVEELPSISVIIPFHNEGRWVVPKIENVLSWHYPLDRLQIVAVSDGSTDGTADGLRRYRDRIRTVIYSPREGKPTALNRGVARATGEVLVFSDANVLVHPDAVRTMVAHYADPQVGGVCGNVALQPDGSAEPLGEGLYMRYERRLYDLESRVATMVGADGALFSIRRALFTPLPADAITDDFDLALTVVRQGRRMHYDPDARGVEIVVPDVRAEFRRKVRMIAGGYQALWRHRTLLNPLRTPMVAFQLWSHKILRWLVPVFLCLVLAASLAAVETPVLAAAAVAQVAFYGLALCGWISHRLRRWMPVYVPYYFCAVNVAAAVGLWRFASGRQPITWQKAQR